MTLLPRPKCPSCKEADASYRQKDRPDLCAWCGYNHRTGAVAGLVSATSPTLAPAPTPAPEDPKHFYACVNATTYRPLGYVQATCINEARALAGKRWPEVEAFSIHRWDGVL